MKDDQIDFTIKLMNGAGRDAAQSILGYLSTCDLPAFKSICEKYADGSATVGFHRSYYQGLEYFQKMTFHNLFESAIARGDLQLIDYLLKTEALKTRIHFLQDQSNWFQSLLSSWYCGKKESRTNNHRQVIDYLILEYGLPFNHHYKRIVESNENYAEIGEIFKSRDLAMKLSKKMLAIEKNEPARKVNKI